MRIAVLLLTLGCASCTFFSSSHRVMVASDPPGAHILLDGVDTGVTTPHVLDLARVPELAARDPQSVPLGFDPAGIFAPDHVIELRRPGYRPERRGLYQYTNCYTSRWIDGAAAPPTPPLPLFWTTGDFVFPFGVHSAIVPGDLYVKLYREDEPLLGFDVLRAKARAAAAAGDAK